MNTEKDSCSTGACAGPGMCPGIALLPSIIIGYGITELSGSLLLGWLVGAPLFLALILGWHKKTARR
ncbi:MULTISPECIES: hypothetical protein [unclassified Lentimonas]|uniref:hypothetical protein n=1 Tax=unclassified Lentimonas TaxID=2630993 RepID=UPI00132A3F55|nr:MULTISPECIES: hypothetical protein [unclassified Lentimonas]CAA6677511.1 Unannotated [Lentimonas sp. CC4]CAA6686481.1 Unannotated [Lentimonas sp. CC6]CAA7074757.1 Unannotated [Lentimonas sp. CC4]CAA7169382.1 Unannotated [Lentimonas sp. CC21]CAA7180225.1 Unannotated [Lentimonas sp. CC8]